MICITRQIQWIFIKFTKKSLNIQDFNEDILLTISFLYILRIHFFNVKIVPKAK